MRIGIAIVSLLVPAIASAETYEIFPTDDLFARLGALVAGDQVIVADIGDDKAGAVARVRKTETTAAAKTEIARN